MFKKILAVLLAGIMMLSIASVTSLAEEETKGNVYKITDIAAKVAADEELVILPGDTLSLEGALNTEYIKVNYTIDAMEEAKPVSSGSYKMFIDYNQPDGYVVKNISEQTTNAVLSSGLKATNKLIDFTAEKATFAGWKVTGLYAKENYNEITFTAVWKMNPPAPGYTGFHKLMVQYIDIIVTYMLNFFNASYNKLLKWLNG